MRDNKGRTALWHAAELAEMQPIKDDANQAMQLLKEAGANPLDVDLAQLALHLEHFLWPICAAGADYVQHDFGDLEVRSISKIVAILDRLMFSMVSVRKEFGELRKALQAQDRQRWLVSGLDTLSFIAPSAAEGLLSWIEFRKKER
ncbi:MAG: hypothetical protein HY645_14845 [Acidobacteria bacterium]|nr:hypothetical protein [Acidobacteriota bacterium]